jgi:hypothetical protein
VGHIASGAGVKFEMRLTLPSRVPLGTNDLIWALRDGRLALPFARTSIDVT